MPRTAAALFAFLVSLTLSAAPALAITNGQIETFSGGLANWFGYSSLETLPDGGPADAGDAYLHNYSSSPSGWLCVNNNSQVWRGDYAAAGITRLEADLINLGSSALYVRSYLSGDGREGGDFTSTSPFLLPADGQWHHVVFGLTAADMTHEPNAGGSNLDVTLHHVTLVSLRHKLSIGQGLGTQTIGSWGLDNIRLVPEPASGISLLLLGAVTFARRRSA